MTSFYNRFLRGVLTFSFFLVACSLLIVSYGVLSAPPEGVAHYQYTDIHREEVESHECRLANGELVNCSSLPNATDIINEAKRQVER